MLDRRMSVAFHRCGKRLHVLTDPGTDLGTMTYAAATTAVAWACATSIIAGASIGSDFTYVPTQHHTLYVSPLLRLHL